MTGGALARLIRSAGERRPPEPVPGEHCDLCQEQVPDEHRHLYDTDGGEVLCACRACSLLFAGEEAAQGATGWCRGAASASRRSTRPAWACPSAWRSSCPPPTARSAAHYPSPRATRCGGGPGGLGRSRGGLPACASCAPTWRRCSSTRHGGRAALDRPVDDCHRVVAIVRREWRMSGGDRVWPAVEQFFAGLETSEPTTT